MIRRCVDYKNRAMAARLSVDLGLWWREFDGLMLRVGARFARVEPRRRMVLFVRGLLAGLPRVNCWAIAEHAGEHGPRGMQRLLSAAVRAPAAAPEAQGEDDLTPRESEVLRLIAAGKSNREIARALFVSEATVKTHVNRIFAKTGSRDRTQAMRYAFDHGYADPPGQAGPPVPRPDSRW